MKKIAFDARGNQKFRKFLTGGVAGGTSIGLGLALMNYLKDLHGETQEDTSADDNVLYLDIPEAPMKPDKPIRKRATISGGVGATAAILGALGSAAAVRKLFQEFKKKELQDQLDKSQVAYTGKVVDEAESLNKKADTGVSMHPGDIASSTPLAALLLTTLASGALTYKGLNKYFPPSKRPTALGPKRVVIRRKKPEPSVYEEDENEDTAKTASHTDLSSQDISDDALEFLVKIAIHHPVQHSDLRDIVYAVASGRHGELCEHGINYGMDSAFDLIKNASTTHIHEERLNLAASQCVKSSFLRPIVEMLAYAEFNDMAASSVKAAAAMSEEAREALIKIASVLGAGFRNEFWANRYDTRFTVKEAAMSESGHVLRLEQLLNNSLGYDPDESENAAQIPLTSETDSEISESQLPEDLGNENAKSRIRVQEQQIEDEDEIDMLLSGMSGGEDQWAENHTAVAPA